MNAQMNVIESKCDTYYSTDRNLIIEYGFWIKDNYLLW